MSSTTTNYSFTLPAVNSAVDEDLWGSELNSNWSSIDTILAAKLSSASPIWTGSGSGAYLALSSGIVGTTTNNSAAIGIVGEYISASVGGVALTGSAAKTITSVSLTAGDWDVEGFVDINTLGVGTDWLGCLSLTDNTVAVIGNPGLWYITFPSGVTGARYSFPTGKLRVSIAATTVVYAVARAIFSTSTASGAASIVARRIR